MKYKTKRLRRLISVNILLVSSLIVQLVFAYQDWDCRRQISPTSKDDFLLTPSSTSSNGLIATQSGEKTNFPLVFQRPTDLGIQSITFTENRGQLDNRIAFHVQGRDTAAYFTAQGLTLAFTEQRNTAAQPDSLTARLEPARVQQRWNLKLDFLDANPNVRPEGRAATATRISYFHGPQTEWQTGLPSYGEIVYRDLWPGIDLVYGGTVNRLKYQFVVRPGADPKQIRLAYRGPETPLVINRNGQLEIATPFGTLHDDRPVSAQGARHDIKTKFVLHGKTRDGGYEYGFRVSKYDRRETLVIDPALLVYSGLIGGSGDDEGHAIAVDSAGNAYITGVTTSPAATFPETAGPDLTYNGRTDAFVAKIKADGSGLAYAGYLGGEGDDEGHSIAVDSAGNAYVTGLTTSFETSFPVTVGPDLTFNGAIDAFVAKINPTGTALDYCGYVGGDDEDEGLGIAVDGTGRAYLTGLTASTETTFPKLSGPKLTFGGAIDAFVARVKADGSSLEYAGYVGGSGDDQGRGIAVDASGNAYIAGQTTSTATSFPMVGTLGTSSKGGTDAFVAKINASGSAISYSGFLGGSGNDEAYSIAVDSAGAAYVTGRTTSTEATFVPSVGPDASFNGGTDAFVAKINAAGSALGYAGYIGGSGDDEAFSIAVDDVGQAYLTGRTTSSAASFPISNAPYQSLKGTSDAFLAKVNAAGTALSFSTYFGGNGEEEGFGAAVSNLRQAYITGRTTSGDGSFPTQIGPGLSFGGASDAFVARFRDTNETLLTTTAVVVTPAAPSYGQPVKFTAAVTANNSPVMGGSATLKLGSTVLAGPTGIGVDGKADLTTNKLVAGSNTVTVEYSGGDGFNGSNVNVTQTIGKAPLTIKAEDKTKIFGAALPTFTALYTGFQLGETAAVLKGTLSFATTATATSDVGTYPITPSGVTADNYDLTFAQGTLTITPPEAFEADVAPRPLGNGRVTIADWVQTGRFAVGIDTPTTPQEYQRIDVAPKSTKGDGRITLADWVQAGRYASGVDDVVAVGGPTAAPSLAVHTLENGLATDAQLDQTRLVRALDASFQRGQVGTVQVELSAQGDENALAFTLNFDPAQVQFNDALVGTDASGATLSLNRTQARDGRIGLAIALPTGKTFAAGARAVLTLRFLPGAGDKPTATQISFSDQTTKRELVNAEAATLATPTFTSATVNITGKAFATVSAASYDGQELAAEQIASAFGADLALGIEAARSLPLPDKLNGTTIKVKDSAGVERASGLFYVSPTQANFLIPAGTADGMATITVTNSAGIVTRGLVQMGKVAPAIFTMDSTGRGLASSTVVRVKANGTRSNEVTGKYDATSGRIVAVPIDLGPESDQVFLELYGTGLRFRSNLAAVRATMGGIAVPVEFAGAQSGYAGLDQLNLKLPRTLLGKGDVSLEVIADDRSANVVRINIR